MKMNKVLIHFHRPLSRDFFTFLVVLLVVWNLSTRIGGFINPSTFVRSLNVCEVFYMIEERLFGLNKRKFINNDLLAVNPKRS